MFVEHKEALEVTKAPARTLKLSEAIRKGLRIVTEDPGKWTCCALGAAFAGVHGRMMTGDDLIKAYVATPEVHFGIADAIGFPRALCGEVNRRHILGDRATVIADWLEAQGY